QDFGVDCEIADLAGLEASFRQVSLTSHDETKADITLQLSISSLVNAPLNKFCFHCAHECDCDNDDSTLKEWILDSGASEHFTPDINDFVDYQVFTKEEYVKTANSTAQIMGK